MKKITKFEHKKVAVLGGKPVRSKAFAKHPVLGAEEYRNVKQVMDSGELSGYVAAPGDFFNGGSMTKALESLCKEYFNCKHAVAMNSATSALHAALLAVGVEPGDEVLVSPYTMSASASAILMCGAIPVFVDIESNYYCIDPTKLISKITAKTTAVVVVHLFGQSADMDPILKLAKKHGVRIVEDCAQAPGAMYKGKPVGSLGDIGVFSFNQHKTITSGEGGVATTNNHKYALKMQLIRNHGEVVLGKMPEATNMNCLGWNYRFTELHAAIALAQFKKLNKLTKHRVRLAEYLSKQLKGIDGIDTPRVRLKSTHVYFVFVMQYDANKIGLSRQSFVKAVQAEGIPMAAGYVRPIYREPLFQRRRIYDKSQFPFNLQKTKNTMNYREGSCPVAELCHDKSLIMTPICRYPLTKTDIDDVVTAIKKVINSAELIGASVA